MSQYDFGTIVATTKSGTALAADLNAWRSAVHSMHKGPTAPSYVTAGMQWCDDTTTPIWIVKQYDGTAWTSMFVIDTTNDKMWPVGTDPRYRYPLAGGTATALTLTPSPALAAYATYEMVTFEAAADTTGATTLNVSTLGAKAVRKITAGADVALEAGDIADAGRYIAVYNTTANAGAGAWILVNPSVVSIPVGTRAGFCGRVAPGGWLFCAGQSVSRTTYSRLFNVIAPVIGTATITIASPAVVTLNAHGLVAGDRVSFETTGALPTGIAVGTNYYVASAGLTANTFQIATSFTTGIVNTSGAQSGVQTVRFTPYGCGNGTTTFIIPDFQGRVSAGRDNMSGTSQNRLTYLGGGVEGDVLGMGGGAESHVLTEAELATHAHYASVTVSGNTGGRSADHTHTIPGRLLNAPGGTNQFGFDASSQASAVNSPQTLGESVDHYHAVTISGGGATDNRGSSAAHTNVQPTIVENVIIKF